MTVRARIFDWFFRPSIRWQRINIRINFLAGYVSAGILGAMIATRAPWYIVLVSTLNMALFIAAFWQVATFVRGNHIENPDMRVDVR